ncbi:PP0621 family protein [Bordetella genomosp. 13]|uniref:MYND finger n=1 Tax=Bordetella genomosp. 13 TaxID=463040 RepID=A0A1W6Z7Q5_9BORD|nr:PP0621 family protein [Bordetella genomosp. 13]ARP93391.1 hypothetical protein CAL15_02740 [Bordetella genomosp. 13]
MSKLLLWVLIVLVVLVAWRIINARAAARVDKGRQPAADRPVRGKGGPATPAETMVRCAHCGIHLPRSEAVQIDGRSWCSQEHARLGPGA